ncbi:hypothetical protein SGLAD_v1c08290 [Spiroplasma gladiatoris]|uniref:Uncharacterized protein n=1 Tax=Spiroplasma gladiatoris TaxID=2143 RepID=A0A4P7AJN9_9MOLU|nr:hypothetical protein [Spiroplasma gladiatoris]QBQ08028.1 hypothetical protein SGLAD_v1c08290 [Spiroplasma gladiatoris]
MDLILVENTDVEFFDYEAPSLKNDGSISIKSLVSSKKVKGERLFFLSKSYIGKINLDEMPNKILFHHENTYESAEQKATLEIREYLNNMNYSLNELFKFSDYEMAQKIKVGHIKAESVGYGNTFGKVDLEIVFNHIKDEWIDLYAFDKKLIDVNNNDEKPVVEAALKTIKGEKSDLVLQENIDYTYKFYQATKDKSGTVIITSLSNSKKIKSKAVFSNTFYDKRINLSSLENRDIKPEQNNLE